MKSLSRALALAPLLFLACEDGPVQTYNPSPDGGEGRWNNSNAPGSSDPATQGFVNTVGGTNLQELCTGDQKAMRWADMVKEPIIPPNRAAGLDLSGGDTWEGLTIETAEKLNCQSENLGDVFGDGDQTNSWGDNYEVLVTYQVSNRKIVFMTLWPGYEGKMSFHSLDKAHTYEMGIQTQIRKDGKPFVLDWTGNGGKNFIDQSDELFRAIMATYAPSQPVDADGVTCSATGRCIKGNFGDVAYFYIPSLGWALWVDNMNAPQPTPSIPTRYDIDLAKVLPYAFAKPTLKLDSEGPIARAGKLGVAPNACTLKMGTTYGDFLKDCVQVNGDAKLDQEELNKLLGGISHGTERFHFNVNGVDVNFSDKTLPADDIVHDADRPSADDVATSFVVDQSTGGRFDNDYDVNGVRDLHGTGAIYKEYMRLVRTRLLAAKNIADGDPKQCLYPDVRPMNFDAKAFEANLPPWCTGFEGFVTPAPPTRVNDPNNLGADNALKVNKNFQLGMKLGHTKVTFCWDANGDVAKGYQFCTSGDVFPASFARALAVFGKGKVANMPTEALDVRFFFRQYFEALVKYMTVGDQNPVPDLTNIKLDSDDLFFDSIGSGQFELAEYVDRRFASKSQNPIDFVFEADVRNGIMDAYVYSRDLFRGEEALYTTVLEDQNDGLGQEHNALLTNIFGSPVLKNGWKDSKQGKSAYYCATHIDPSNCDEQLPPLDQNGAMLLDDMGRPILLPYPGAFGTTSFSLGATPVRIVQEYPEIQSAMVRIPLHVDPYNTKSQVLPPLNILIPWVPKQPGEGFPVALNGTLDKFIEASQLDMDGTTITANVDYNPVLDPTTHLPKKDGSIEFLAVETTDFLGDVFICQDERTHDLLKVRMYSPVATVLDWFASHPGSYQSCGMIIRYSPFGNFPDFISSINNGVRLGITQGGGYGRVVDVTLFVPGQ
jgi:hypothetical protein